MTENTPTKDNNQFNYDLMDSQTASELKLIERNIAQIKSITLVALGEQLTLAQKQFAKWGGDHTSKDREQSPNFGLWLEDQGFTKQTGYNIINAYKEYKQLDTQSQEVFETLPKQIAYAVSAPSASNELKEAVYNGDITTTKEFKEFKASMDKQINRLNETLAYSETKNANISARLGQVSDQYKLQSKTVEELQAKKEQLEKSPITIEVEKMPADYEKLKKDHAKAISELERISDIALDAQNNRDSAQLEIDSLKAELDIAGNTKEQVAELEERIKDKNEELIEAENNVLNTQIIAKFATASNQLLQTMGGTMFEIDFSLIGYNDTTVQVLISAKNRLKELVNTLEEKTNQFENNESKQRVINK